jgi:hypothetical protein
VYHKPNVLLTITTPHRPATELGYLLHKNPTRPQVFDLGFGKLHVFYSEASDDTCTAALMLPRIVYDGTTKPRLSLEYIESACPMVRRFERHTVLSADRRAAATACRSHPSNRPTMPTVVASLDSVRHLHRGELELRLPARVRPPAGFD